MEAYTKLLSCAVIFDRKSVAPSSGIFGGDRRRGRPMDKIRNFKRKKTFSKKVSRPLPRLRPDFRGGGGALLLGCSEKWGPRGSKVHN